MHNNVIYKATEASEILSITRIIHDCKFDRDKLVFDSASSSLSIEFEYEELDKKIILSNMLLIKKIRIPITKYVLIINNIKNYIYDTSNYNGPGLDDFFNKILYDDELNKITILTIIGAPIDVFVTKLNISIEDTYELVGEKIKIVF